MLRQVVSSIATCLLFVAGGQAVAADSLSASAAVSASDDIVLNSNVIHYIPYGISQTGAFTVPAVDVSSGRLNVFMDGATCGAQAITVRYTSIPNQASYQTMLANRDGSFSFTANRIYFMQFDVSQNVYTTGVCKFRVVIDGPSGGDDGDGDSGDFELLGVVSYEGGFASRLPVAVSPSAVVKAFRVEIPEFCGGAEVLEAGTISEGIFDRADAGRGDGVYSVNGGAGLRVSALALTLNGPANAPCTIPVYVKY